MEVFEIIEAIELENMEGLECFGDGLFENCVNVEEEFISCCEDEEWKDSEECIDGISSEEDFDYEISSNEDVDELSLRMFFKGISVCKNGCLASRNSAIGVIIETSDGDCIIQVQKKLDFFVEDVVADHLALLDGLVEAQRKGVQRIVAFTDSVEVYNQIAEAEPHEDQLLVALAYRIIELANKLEAFVLKLVCKFELSRPLKLAQQAIGILDGTNLDKIYCPFPNCSMLLSPSQCSSSRASSSFHSDNNCVECQECHRLVCFGCGVPWHTSMSCEEYQSVSVHDDNWRRCEQCRSLIKLPQGFFHVTCRCGHEFCHLCGADYHDGNQTCQCAIHDYRVNDSNTPGPSTSTYHESNHWRWEPLNLVSSITDGCSEQERAQIATIQRFLAGGFGFVDDNHGINPCQPPSQRSDPYLDTIKDLNQLPWLERFVSVISDCYDEDYGQ